MFVDWLGLVWGGFDTLGLSKVYQYCVYGIGCTLYALCRLFYNQYLCQSHSIVL